MNGSPQVVPDGGGHADARCYLSAVLLLLAYLVVARVLPVYDCRYAGCLLFLPDKPVSDDCCKSPVTVIVSPINHVVLFAHGASFSCKELWNPFVRYIRCGFLSRNSSDGIRHVVAVFRTVSRAVQPAKHRPG